MRGGWHGVVCRAAQTLTHFRTSHPAVLCLAQRLQAVGVSPNTATFTTLINACAKSAELGRALSVLQQMHVAKVTPDTITYTALINACSRTQQLVLAVTRTRSLAASRISHGGPECDTAALLTPAACRPDRGRRSSCSRR